MIRDLTPAANRSPFHASIMNLAGLLLCVFTTLAVLINASHDQSGVNLSEVTAAFRGALRDHGREDFAVIAAGFRKSNDEPNRSVDLSQISGNVSRKKVLGATLLKLSEEEESGPLPAENSLPVDVNGPVFTHLMTELQRFCSVSRAVEFDGQLALDLQSHSQQSDSSVRDALERVLRTCRTASGRIPMQPAEVEIVMWASMPTTDALSNATEEAFDLEQSLRKFLKADASSPIPLSSSGRLWTRPNSPRPLATIFIRTARQ